MDLVTFVFSFFHPSANREKPNLATIFVIDLSSSELKTSKIHWKVKKLWAKNHDRWVFVRRTLNVINTKRNQRAKVWYRYLECEGNTGQQICARPFFRPQKVNLKINVICDMMVGDHKFDQVEYNFCTFFITIFV